ncbi:hypothetical protein GCM10011386_32090 [Parapedobacter defluvii]|uniref:Uncharacterized protein n=1 Tax=Parapedobacter defluvii TaxID=2045106 RepID=A0ABQ1MAY7_9SPHI|nr:hypothetical protein GCM10011386_32090 [Parapedobacter defluvii]
MALGRRLVIQGIKEFAAHVSGIRGIRFGRQFKVPGDIVGRGTFQAKEDESG